ncbi:MAG: hypothetical protein RIB47_03590 [Cyclobacteriaceae bacterium]
MKQTLEYEKDLAIIRATMERSAKFLSLSGLSGIMAGIYALIGAAYAYSVIYYPSTPLGVRLYVASDSSNLFNLIACALIVLVLSVVTAYVLSIRKAKKNGENAWNKPSKLMLINIAIPLVAGGIFTAIMIANGYYLVFASSTLIFYGIALINGSQFTFRDIRYLGLLEIVLGLLSAAYPELGLVFWAIGFGLLHIIYGSIMHLKYDR